MAKIFFMKPFIEWISKGKFFAKVFAIILRVLAVLIALGALVAWVLMWKVVVALPASGIVGGVIFQLIYVIAVYMVVHLLFLRASHIAKLPEGDYKVVPIVSIFMKLLGEVYASFLVAMAIGGAILIWFAGSEALRLIRNLPLIFTRIGGASFLSGLVFMLWGILFAFFTLVAFYLIAELLVVAVDVATHMKVTRQIAERYGKAKRKA